MKQLIIVESPSKAKTIQKYLGGDVVVLASKGHICDLPTRSLGIDIADGFKPQYVVTPDKKETIDNNADRKTAIIGGTAIAACSIALLALIILFVRKKRRERAA